MEFIASREMRSIEENAVYFGVSLLQLMENAGRNVALEVNSRFKFSPKIVVVCGLGGNGGDGFVATRHLLAMGHNVSVLIVGQSKEIKHPDALHNFRILQKILDKNLIQEVSDSVMFPKLEADIVIDALLGTGSKGNLKPLFSAAVDWINSSKAKIVSIDVPTGIDSDTGELLGRAVRADLTVTFYKAKKGLDSAKKYCGAVIIRDIGLPQVFEKYTGPGDVSLVNKKRSSMAHKGDSGKLLVVGGSEVFSGAPTLASSAALRTGVDVVFTAAPSLVAHDISSVSPNLIVIKLEGNNLNFENIEKLKSYIKTVDAVVL
ncbi:MAG: NAD(P)H-hydrate epimerase, partial [Crenarchaeota archaeon]|nr:NAD(P)H-hydrate epimerase [Thermoproteota archaeon]